MKSTDVIVVGSGMAGLSTACLLARDGLRVQVLERNWLPGGCSSSYPRKGYVFESGATTLVGLDPGMPLRHLLDETGIQLAPLLLDLPMRVYLRDGRPIERHHNLESWIQEAERVFGPAGQRAFWTYCYAVSRFVWDTSLCQRAFPPSALRDLLVAARNFHPAQLRFATLAFRSMRWLLRRHGLDQHQDFVDFVNEQLLITAQNHLDEVNVLFGATALCYTNFGNYYMPGGLVELVNPLIDYLRSQGSEVVLRAPVTRIARAGDGYRVETRYRQEAQVYHAPRVVCAIPANNVLDLFDDDRVRQHLRPHLLDSPQLNSAFQLGFAMRRGRDYSSLHHQIHLPAPLPYTGSHSIFLSLSHPADSLRCGPDEVVGSVSTHVPDPARCTIEDKEQVAAAIFDVLEARGLLRREDLLYWHASTPGSWEKWTGRAWGFVGGYPQYLRIKPWQMLDARLDHRGAYLCGDSAYPGQGIPGACLSGIIAYEKMKLDGLPAPISPHRTTARSDDRTRAIPAG
ncbi:MAG: C-3',4' desaturase CrtD [Bacteroidia bacterium]